MFIIIFPLVSHYAETNCYKINFIIIMYTILDVIPVKGYTIGGKLKQYL